MDEYGIFNDEGLIEGDFWTMRQAEGALSDYRETARAEDQEAWDESAYAAKICSEHPEQAYEYCEECLGEDSESA